MVQRRLELAMAPQVVEGQGASTVLPGLILADCGIAIGEPRPTRRQGSAGATTSKEQ